MDKRIIDLTENELAEIINYQIGNKLKEFIPLINNLTINQDKDLMTLKECSEFLNKSIRTIQNWTKTGKIPVLNLDNSNSVYYSKKEIMAEMYKNRGKYQI